MPSLETINNQPPTGVGCANILEITEHHPLVVQISLSRHSGWTLTKAAQSLLGFLAKLKGLIKAVTPSKIGYSYICLININ